MVERLIEGQGVSGSSPFVPAIFKIVPVCEKNAQRENHTKQSLLVNPESRMPKFEGTIERILSNRKKPR